MKEHIQETILMNGKYNCVFDEKTGEFYAKRYGEKWRDLTGDGMTLALCQRIWELECRPGYEKHNK